MVIERVGRLAVVILWLLAAILVFTTQAEPWEQDERNSSDHESEEKLVTDPSKEIVDIVKGISTNILLKETVEMTLEWIGHLDDLEPGQTEHDHTSISDALVEFQEHNELAVTGELDKETQRKMLLPRCGIPDVPKPKDRIVGNNAARSNRQRRFEPDPSWFRTYQAWTKHNLTYQFVQYTSQLTRDQQNDAIARAFGKWAAVTPLTFLQVYSSDPKPDLTVGFYKKKHGDGYSFDGTGMTLAHAFFPEDGRIHFDDDEVWSVDSDKGTDLNSVATHEIGHSLGLSHSFLPEALMAPFYSYSPEVTLHQDDVDGIHFLYTVGCHSRRTGCLHGGTCQRSRTGGVPECVCTELYTGPRCRKGKGCQLPNKDCLNGGTCLEGKKSYLCRCPPGYEGERCESGTTCDTQQTNCLNGGRCIHDGQVSFCECPKGYSGKRCSVGSGCLSDGLSCLNGGKCQNEGDHFYKCACPVTHDGTRCEIAKGCNNAAQACNNGGTCYQDGSRFRCQCADGYWGFRCEDVTHGSCMHSNMSCLHGGTCNADGRDSYTCTCPTGHPGNRCQKASGCDVPEFRCLNSGSCPFGRCTCKAGFGGSQCENRYFTDCHHPNMSCLNGGTCNSNNECSCPNSFGGMRCEEKLFCTSPSMGCLNGGSCDCSGERCYCQCTVGFYGERCERHKGGRGDNPYFCNHPDLTCLNEGHCVKNRCRCSNSYSGRRCHTMLSCLREEMSCLNRGTCGVMGYGFGCHCASGFGGIRCEQRLGCHKPSAPCLNGGTCEPEGTCRCPDWYNGERCEIVPDCLTDDSQCLNGGTCKNFQCICPPGFGGERCHLNTGCRNKHSSCLNGGTCALAENGMFMCRCREGYGYQRCQRATECLNPDLTCLNGGTCRTNRPTPYCVCPDGFQGRRCQVGTDCQNTESSCLNGGTCEEVNEKHFQCRCPPGFQGSRCHKWSGYY